MIQEYLNEQFIQTTEDANFVKLKKACADVAKKISKDKAKILSFSLVAFDPEVPADNQEIAEIKQLIIDNWQTFLSNSKDTTLTIIRAVILDALKVASKETSSACLIWFACRHTFKQYKLGREKPILTNFVLELANRIESEVSESWDFSPDYEVEIPKITTAIVDVTELTTHVQPNAVNAVGVAEVINKALKKQIVELKENQKQFVHLNSLMQMRTQLLWWKESGYSPLLKGSYKGINDGQLQVVLAYDYSNFIPEMYPMSVDYFLLEAHKTFSQYGEKKMKISDFLKMVEQSNSEIIKVVPEYVSDNNRISFANFIQGFVHGKYQAKQFKKFVGVDDTTELNLGEFTLWIFHDLHSIKLSKSK
jgi:hypothetical protein